MTPRTIKADVQKVIRKARARKHARPPDANQESDDAFFRRKAREIAETARTEANLEDECREKVLLHKHAAEAARDELEKMALAEDMPLFNRQAAVPGANGMPVCDPSLPLVAAGKDGWQQVLIREALPGLAKTLYQKMEDAELRTMGEYSAYCNAARPEFGKHPLTCIPGIGQQKAELIQAAELKFWKKVKQTKPDAQTFAEQEAESADGEPTDPAP